MRFIECDSKKDKVFVGVFNNLYSIRYDLVELRKAKGLTQKEVAARSGLTQQMISKLEKSTSNGTIETFLKYVHALDAQICIK